MLYSEIYSYPSYCTFFITTLPLLVCFGCASTTDASIAFLPTFLLDLAASCLGFLEDAGIAVGVGGFAKSAWNMSGLSSIKKGFAAALKAFSFPWPVTTLASSFSSAGYRPNIPGVILPKTAVQCALNPFSLATSSLSLTTSKSMTRA